MMRPLGPGMMQQIQQPCSHCNQTGYSVPNYDMCGGCHSKVLFMCLLLLLQHSLLMQSGFMLCVSACCFRVDNVAAPAHLGQLITSRCTGDLMICWEVWSLIFTQGTLMNCCCLVKAALHAVQQPCHTHGINNDI